jgi:hypothetical protein
MSSAYGWAAGAYPFGAIEAIWTALAYRRWRRRISGDTIASQSQRQVTP